MIWPVSDCDDLVELIVVPNYHTGSKHGYLTVQTAAYFAWWTDGAPEHLCIRRTDGEGEREWVELALDAGVFTDTEAASSPVTERASDSGGKWQLDPSTPQRHVVRGESAAIEWVDAGTRPGCTRVRVEFQADAIRYQALWKSSSRTRIQKLRLCQGSRVDTTSVFDPAPAAHGIFYHPPHRLHHDGGNWFSPPPFAVCFHLSDGSWCAASVEARLEQLEFSRFHVESTQAGGLDFVLDYPSLPELSADFASPALVWRFGFQDEFAALRAHAEGMVRAGLACRPQRSGSATNGRATMVCGWHRQVELATLANHAPEDNILQNVEAATGAPRSQNYARQDVYEEHVAAYERAGIPFDILTIDHGWSLSEGDWSPDPEKWPDLPAFVRARRREGRKVLLWICSLSIGLPAEECVRIGDEGETRLDPDNPLWQQRVAKSLEFLLGSGDDAVGADGLKFDFTGPMKDPRPAFGSGEILHGYRYLHRLFEVVSKAARRARPDCVLNYQCANPQFAALHDMTRLNDFFLPQAQAVRVMKTRADIARAAAFDPMIDTDAPAGVDYLTHSSRFGNISLYLTHEQLDDPALVAAIKENQARS